MLPLISVSSLNFGLNNLTGPINGSIKPKMFVWYYTFLLLTSQFGYKLSIHFFLYNSSCFLHNFSNTINLVCSYIYSYCKRNYFSIRLPYFSLSNYIFPIFLWVDKPYNSNPKKIIMALQSIYYAIFANRCSIRIKGIYESLIHLSLLFCCSCIRP